MYTAFQSLDHHLRTTGYYSCYIIAPYVGCCEKLTSLVQFHYLNLFFYLVNPQFRNMNSSAFDTILSPKSATFFYNLIKSTVMHYLQHLHRPETDIFRYWQRHEAKLNSCVALKNATVSVSMFKTFCYTCHNISCLNHVGWCHTLNSMQNLTVLYH